MSTDSTFKPYLSTFVGTPYYLGVPQGQISCEDVAELPKNATVVELERPFKNLDQLPRFPKIRRIDCDDFRADWLPHLAKLPDLRHLQLSFLRTQTLPALKRLKSLRVLVLYNLAKLKSLEFLRGMNGLHSLGISECLAANDLAPLATLKNLRELDLDGAPLKAGFVESLEPLGKLRRLEFLSLACRIRPENPSLRPLAKLTELRTLILSERFPDDEKDWLLDRLPKLKAINGGLSDQYPSRKKAR
jgi:Leucine-rich repeat (LRR) protein